MHGGVDEGHENNLGRRVVEVVVGRQGKERLAHASESASAKGGTPTTTLSQETEPDGGDKTTHDEAEGGVAADQSAAPAVAPSSATLPPCRPLAA